MVIEVMDGKLPLGEKEGAPREGSAQSRGTKLYVPSQCQFSGSSVVGGETRTVALNHVNFPVPPANVHTPLASEQLPNALLLPDPGGSRTTSLPERVKS